MNDINILVAEDDAEINKLIADELTREGYNVISVFDGINAALKLEKGAFQMLILDIMLPKCDGYEVLSKMRRNLDIPVLILSAKNQETDKIIGLGLGADDYMTKPFSVAELTARVKAQLRRYLKFSANEESIQIIKHNDIQINLSTFEVKTRDKDISLTAKEFEILKLFMLNPKKVFTKSQLFCAIWGTDYLKDENTVMVHIRRLREKIEEDPSNPKYIKTIWGIGYKFADE